MYILFRTKKQDLWPPTSIKVQTVHLPENKYVFKYFRSFIYLFIYFKLAGAEEDHREISGHLDQQRDQNIL